MGYHSSLALLIVKLICNTSEYLNALFVDLWSCEYYKYVLKRVSFGSKDCTKELKLERAYFLGQSSKFLPFSLHQ